MIMFRNYNQRETLYRSKVKPFVKGSSAHSTITYVRNGDCILVLHPGGKQYSGHHRNHVAEMRDWTNKALVHVTKVNIEVSSTGRSPRLRHILGKNLAGLYPFYKDRTQISDQWCDEVARL